MSREEIKSIQKIEKNSKSIGNTCAPQQKNTLAISSYSSSKSSIKYDSQSRKTKETNYLRNPFENYYTAIGLEINQLEELKYVFLELLSNKLEEISEENSLIEKQCPKEFKEINQTLFYSKLLPEISLKDYLIRIVKYCKAELSTCIIASIYIDRLCQEARFYLTWRNVYR